MCPSSFASWVSFRASWSVSRWCSGDRSSARGRHPKDVVDAVRLDLVAIHEGSATLELETHDPQLTLISDNTLTESFRALAEGIGRIES